MKNLKLSVKLLGSFILVAVIAAVIGGYGIYQIRNIDNRDTELYELNTKPLGEMGNAAIQFQMERVLLRDFIILKFMLKRDASEIGGKLKAAEGKMLEELKVFEKTIRRDEVRKEFENLKTLISGYHQVRD
ncbi:MAG: MCP four helix bundle domain-containing protein, partial [Syntrophales bacterium]|nr:MCP four helix bundle domain-containing protein [Syntrophales bacterium]